MPVHGVLLELQRRDSSGMNSSDRPVLTSSSSPAPGRSATSSLSSSSAIRSADTMPSRSRIAAMAFTTRADGSTPSCATNRAARSIRSGSSPNATSGSSGVSSVFVARSRTPPNGSTNSPDGSRTAIALIVKSRRDRSVSTSFANVTAGLRLSSHVDVLAEGGDLQQAPVLARPHGAELRADEVPPVGPVAQHLCGLVRLRVGGEIEVGRQGAAPQHQVPHRAAHQEELVAGVVEPFAQLLREQGRTR